MKRVFLFLQVSVLVSGLAAGAAPVVRTISGNPLTINVGDDTSFQIFNSSVPGSGQIYPTTCTSDTADMGVFIRTGSNLIAPDFGEHPCGSATGGIGSQAWNNRTISAVTGSGTSSDPFAVTVMADATPASDILMAMLVTYVNGQGYFTISVGFNSANAVTYDAFLGADLYLASSDSGIPFRIPASGSVGGQTCSGTPYTILLVPLTASTGYTARSFGQVWFQIGTGALDDIVDNTGCEDDGAALEWAGRSIGAGGTDVILAAASFGEIPPIAQCTPPGAPGNPTIAVTADSSLPVTATDYVTYHWDPASTGGPQDGYQYQINSDTPQRTTDNTLDFQGPLGLRPDAPVTLSVFGFACSPEQDGPTSQSPPYSLAPPVASFSVSSPTASVGGPLIFTDTSSPQATSWLWFFGDNGEETSNNPTHIYAASGGYTVFLVATNGSGSSVSAPQTIIVTAGGGAGPASRREPLRPHPGQDDGPGLTSARPALSPESPRQNWSLGTLRLAERNRTFLALSSAEGTIAYLRFERAGALLAERRLQLLAGETARVDLGAYPGWDHDLPVDVRVVADRPVTAALESEE
jgi:PKD repeat protein